ncbi:MAG: aspartyl/asparaginyl beta-hydroxylase domain-containing protein [Sphingomonas sp.]
MSSAPQQPALEVLLDRADNFAGRGDAKAAMSFYQAALRSARTAPVSDQATAQRLRNAQDFIEARSSEFLRSLDQALAHFAPEAATSRLRLMHALQMLKGERSIYPQQPSVFYYPYLAQRQFFERDEFDWAEEFEAETAIIRDELVALLTEGAPFRPYVDDDPERPRRDFHGLNNNPSWSAFYLWKEGQLVEENAARCPRTVEALKRLPLTHIGARTPVALFSRLGGGAHIPPHFGMLNSRVVCHLPLIVPKGGWLRVGNETREWEEGKLLIFDDSIEHEARNPEGQLRTILIFDVWRPELSDTERQAISAIFHSIDSFQALPDA